MPPKIIFSFPGWPKLRTYCSAAALIFAISAPVHAETLKEALTAAYLFNPTLKSARAQLRATDNQVSLAKSGYRPTISAQFQYGYEDVRTTSRKKTGATECPQCGRAFWVRRRGPGIAKAEGR